MGAAHGDGSNLQHKYSLCRVGCGSQTVCSLGSHTEWGCTCPGFPGCSDGFESITPQLTDVIRKVEVGEAVIQAMPLDNLIDTACAMIKENPTALLCDREDCERCNTVRASIPKPVKQSSQSPKRRKLPRSGKNG